MPTPASAWPCTRRGDDGGDADGAEQREGSRRADEAVDAMCSIDRAEQRKGAGRRQYAGHVGVGDALDRHPETGTADEFGGRDQRNAEDAGHCEPYFRAENAGLDRIADEKEATERQRHAADPDRPARTQRGFDGRPRRFCCRRLGWGSAAGDQGAAGASPTPPPPCLRFPG